MKNALLTFVVATVVGCTSSYEPESLTDSTFKQDMIAENIMPPTGEMVSVNELKSSLSELSRRLDTIHPDPGFTMDLPAVKAQIASLSEGVSSPMTHYEAWKTLSQLNPLFKDGHMLISSAQLDAQFKSHVNNGGSLFPFDVVIDESQRLLVAEPVENYPELEPGDEIISVNGVKASKIIDTILARMYGDSLTFRTAVIASRFSKMYWLLFGSSKNYQIEVVQNKKRRHFSIAGVSNVPGAQDLGIEEFVERKILADDIGYLRVDRFFYSPEQEKPFFTFMDETWQEFKKANVKDVIIDVRNNPGGTDHYWQQGIAPFIASKPFLFLSHFKIRMTQRNIELGPVQGPEGEIIEGPFNQLVPVDGHKGLRIPGQAYLLMGPQSYSSTILFLTALKDSKQAVIAGQSNVRSCTTGRIETVTLPGSNLELTMPTLIFTRPSGKELCQQAIKPDIHMSSKIINSNEAVTELARAITANR